MVSPDDVFSMSTPWQTTMIDRLSSTACAPGGWSYRTGSPAAAEPTALVCLAMIRHGMTPDHWQHGLTMLARIQEKSGGVPSTPSADSPYWPTGLAIAAWNAHDADSGHDYEHPIDRAVQWLVNTRGCAIPNRPDIYGHNSQLQGWSWVEGTHSWLEPTAYGVLGLRAVGQDHHPRTREAVVLLRDRMFPSGGWNYGNTRTFGRTLRPFPGTTGIVLTALAGARDIASIKPSVHYLNGELQHVRSPMSLAWGVIGLTECGVRPREADTWLSESALRALGRDASPLEDALLLLADPKSPPFGCDAAQPRESQVNG